MDHNYRQSNQSECAGNSTKALISFSAQPISHTRNGQLQNRAERQCRSNNAKWGKQYYRRGKSNKTGSSGSEIISHKSQPRMINSRVTELCHNFHIVTSRKRPPNWENHLELVRQITMT